MTSPRATPSLEQCLERQLAFYSDFLEQAGRAPEQHDGLKICWLGTRNPYFNTLHTIEVDKSVNAEIVKEAARILSDRLPLPGYLVVWSSSAAPPPVAPSLVHDEAQVFMRLDLANLVPSAAGLPPGFELQRATTEPERLQMVQLWAETTGNAVEEVDIVTSTWFSSAIAIAISLNGQLVASASAVMSGGTIFVGLVVTLPQYQRRGLGQVAVAEALVRAKEETGVQEAFLEGMPDGIQLYNRLGFGRVAYKHVYRLADQM